MTSIEEQTNSLGRPSPVIDMRDIPLGTLVHRAGLLTAEQLEGALAEGSATGKRLGEVLIERGLLEERQVAELVAGQKGLPFVELQPESVDPEAVKLLPQIAARQFGALAIALEEGVPVVAIADPADQEVVDFIGERLEGEFRLVVAARAEIERAARGPIAPSETDTTSPAAQSPVAPEATELRQSAPVPEPVPPPVAPPPPVPQPTPAAFRLVLRLLNGELLELGSFEDRASADASAAHVVQQLIAGEAAGWLAFDGRYVRPGAVVSLDVV